MEAQQNNIALYAAIKTFHTEGNDIWGTVSALTLLVVENNSNLTSIKTSFSDFYEIDIPTETLKTVISRLKRDELLKEEKTIITLTELGGKRKASLEGSVKRIRREYSSLHKNFISYLNKQKITGISQVDIALLNFIDDNIGFTSEILTTLPEQKIRTIPVSAIAKYIIHIEKNEPDLFEIFQNIFFGRLYLTLMKTRTEVDAKAKFDNLLVILDTNVLLSLLGLHDDSLGQTANELLNILKLYQESITVVALDITIEECLTVLHAHAHDQTEYANHIKVDSDAYRLRLKQIDKRDLNLLIENFDEKVESLGISIVTANKPDSEKLQDTSSDIARISTINQQEKNANALKHDASVMENIKMHRKGIRSALLEKSKAVFVTQDKTLVSYAREVNLKNHKFLLAIRPVDIMSLLWVKSLGSNKHNVSGNFLRHAVMGYARERLIDSSLWDNFVQKMEEAKKKGTISESDINIILASDETERLLATNNKKVVNSIVNQEYIDRLRAEHNNLRLTNTMRATKIKELDNLLATTTKQSDAEKAHNLNILGRFKYISHSISNIIVVTIGVILTLLSALILHFLLNKLGLEALVSWIAVALYILSIAVTTIFGKELKFTKILLSTRENLVRICEKKTYDLLCKIFAA